MDSKQLKWVYLLLLAAVWGSSFILIKRGLVGLNPMQLGALRIVFAAIFLGVVGFKNILKIPLFLWKFIALTAVVGTFIPVFLLSVAQTQIDSSVSAILNSLTPLHTLLIGSLAFGVPCKRKQFFGVLFGLLGTSLLLLNGAMLHPEQNYYYAILVLIASICYAANVHLIKKYLNDLSPLSITAGNFSVLLIPALLVLFSNGFIKVIDEPEVQNSMLYILVLGVIGTGIANVVFFKTIQMASPVFATSVTYLIPIVAFFWGLLDGEMLSAIQFIGAFIILVGVYLSAKK